jgi:hypothetical protein
MNRHPKITNDAHRRGGFTLIDVLVSIAVIAVLIAILLPSISMVRESARKVICSSDMRQLGVGLSMFSEDNRGLLPESVYLEEITSRQAYPTMPHLMDTVRTDADEFAPREWGNWDGLGVLFAQAYINAPGVYYCPSHRGSNMEIDATPRWGSTDTRTLVSNYQFRGVGPEGERELFRIGNNAALVTDTLRSFDELNHEDGFNILTAGLAVSWFADANGLVESSIMARSASDDGDDESIASDVIREWGLFDGLGETQ